METMLKLYKFRSLEDGKKLSHAKKVLETGEFWCASLWNQNDPMEGIFRDEQNVISPEVLRKLFSEKNKKRICSFSSVKAFALPTMWGYYANGFKGMAIEIEVARKEVKAVNYDMDVAQVAIGAHSDSELLERILTTKLDCWTHEDEYRYIFNSDEDRSHKIGQIKAVHFGWAYNNVENAMSIRANARSLEDYIKYVDELLTVAEAKQIPTFAAHIVGKKVVSTLSSRSDFAKSFGGQALWANLPVKKTSIL